MARRNGEERATLAALVSVAADRWPDDPALIGDEARLTWAEVERRTGSLARCLVANGVRPGDRVAVARPKGSESFEAVHGILRAGAAVVPIDPSAPPDAARDVIIDAEVSAIVGDIRTIAPIDPWRTCEALRCIIATGGDHRSVDWEHAISAFPTGDLPVVQPDDIAYLIYTSGSTGRPKGIVHTHASGRSYANSAAEARGLRHDDRVAGMCALHFDMSTFELYAAPLVGACVVVVGDALMRMFLAEFSELCERERVSVWYTVPFFLRQLTERGAIETRDLSALRLVMYGGEPFPPGALRELMEALPGVEICNVYGPAEVNECTSHTFREPPAEGAEVPIGRPWDAADVRIVDEAGAEVAVGSPGELMVSATTAMREYWRRPELTRDRLHPRPDGPPWYATGDMARRDANGLLWFLGRRDFQVKIRGVRIELEAIESVLTDAPGVAHAVACTIGPGGDRSSIAAAVVGVDGRTPDVDDVRRWCATRLPPIAVPRVIQVWDEFPATASGKIDRTNVRAAVADHDRVTTAREGHGSS